MKPLSWACALFLLAAISTSLLAADVTGKWSGQFKLDIRETVHPFTLDLKPDGSRLTGTWCFVNCDAGGVKTDILDGTIDGDTISFGIPTDESDLPRLDFHGTVDGDTIKFDVTGTAIDCHEANCITGEGSATRVK
jgi:hypothetical protein